MKHILYIFYIIFYASAVFLAGIFAGQLVERKNKQKSADRSRLKPASSQSEKGTGPVLKSKPHA